MDKEILDDFGSLLMEHVRDRVIVQMRNIVSGKVKDGTFWYFSEQKKKYPNNPNELIEAMIPIVVDATIGNFLWLIEESNLLDLTIETLEGKKSVKQASDGLSGELYTADGWIARFSDQRNPEKDIFRHG